MPRITTDLVNTPSTEFIADRLGQFYDIAVDELTFLGGEVDRNYRLRAADGNTYLVKVQTAVGDGAELYWQEAILVHLRDKDLGFAVPRIAQTVGGDLHVPFELGSDVGLLRVLDWISGTELSRVDEHSPLLLRELGAAAATITAALEGFSAPSFHATHHWDLIRSGDIIRDSIADDSVRADDFGARSVLAAFDAVAPELPDLPRAMVHHDLNDNNVLVAENGGRQTIAGVLDFNDALYSVRVAEPTIAGAYAMLRKDDPLTALGHVIGGYHAVTKLTMRELGVVWPLAVARLCMQALTWTIRGRTTPSAYGSMRMQHTLPTLARIVDVDPDEASAYLRSVCLEVESK